MSLGEEYLFLYLSYPLSSILTNFHSATMKCSAYPSIYVIDVFVHLKIIYILPTQGGDNFMET
jgi:hypothetical protein